MEDLYVWGDNRSGALGLNHNSPERAPLAVEGLQSGGLIVKEVGCGLEHMIIVTEEDEVYLSGSNAHGQLAMDEMEQKQLVPVFSEELSKQKAAMVACGEAHSVMVCEDEGGHVVKAFGSNLWGQLGIEQGEENKVGQIHTIRIHKGSLRIAVVSVACGSNHTLLLSKDGAVYSWGANGKGQCGLGHTQSKVYQPSLVTEITHGGAIACGDEHSAVLVEAAPSERGHGLMMNKLYVFGSNKFGQLGVGEESQPSFEFVTTPRELNDLDIDANCSINSVWCGSNHTMIQVLSVIIRRDSNNVEQKEFKKLFYAFGRGSEGQLGSGSLHSSTEPIKIDRLTNCEVQGVALGRNTTFVWIEKFLDDPNTLPGLYACGSNQNGELGLGPDREMATHFTRVDGIPQGMKGRIIASSFAVAVPGKFPKYIPPQLPFRTERLVLDIDSLDKKLKHQETKSQISPPRPLSPPALVTSPHSPAPMKVLDQPLAEFVDEDPSALESHSLAQDMGFLLNQQFLADVLLQAGRSNFDDLWQVNSPALTPSRPDPESTNSKKKKQNQIHPTMGNTSSGSTETQQQKQSQQQPQQQPKLFPAHMAILQCRCPRIAQLAQTEVTKAISANTLDTTLQKGSEWCLQRRAVVVQLDGVSEVALEHMLRIIYTGSADILGKLSDAHLIELAYAAKTYGLDRMLSLCQKRIGTILDSKNAVFLLGNAHRLHLLAIKRLCLEFIKQNYNRCVSDRNHASVAMLKDPVLLAEVLGLSSSDVARSIIQNLPPPLQVRAGTLVHDLARLKDGGTYFANVEIIPSCVFDEHGGNTESGIPCHAIILAARCPVFRDALKLHFGKDQPHYSITGRWEEKSADKITTHLQRVRNGKGIVFEHEQENKVSAESGKLLKAKNVQELIIHSNGTQTVVPPVIRGISKESNRIEIIDVTEANPKSIRVFLEYLYTDSTKNVSMDNAIDILMMTHVYGIEHTRLSRYCEALLSNNMNHKNVIDIMCVARLLHLGHLEERAIRYFVANSHECMYDSELVADAVADFPDLAVKLMGLLPKQQS